MGVQQSKIEWFHANKYHNWLVVWNMFLCFHILGKITPTDELIFFRGVQTTSFSASFSVADACSVVGARQLGHGKSKSTFGAIRLAVCHTSSVEANCSKR